MKTLASLCLSSALVGLLCGCGGQANTHDHAGKRKSIVVSRPFKGSYPIQVAATTGMVADLVRQIGGAHVHVEQLLASDVDPHTYAPTGADVSKLGKADVIFYNGLDLEGKMAELFDGLSQQTPTFGICDYLPAELRLDEEEGVPDPHVWFDVSLWGKVGGIVAEALEKYDAKNKDEYQKRLAAFQAELASLHEYAQKQIASIPSDQRVLITSHDAFHYFGNAYKIAVKAPQGISTASEASVRDINDLVAFIVERKIKAVFVETSVNPRNMQALLEGCQKNGHQVVIGGKLFSDAMGKAGTPEGTYVGMIRHNVDTIVKALK